MIQRLVETLAVLAAPVDQQPQESLGTVIANYADALMLVTDCPQIELTHAQRMALERVQEHLGRTRLAEDVAAREEVRRYASAALIALGA